MFCIESLEKKGHRDLLQSRKSLLLFRRTTPFLLLFYHLSLISHSLGTKPYIQKWSCDKIKWRAPKKVAPSAAFMLQYPLRWKKVLSEALGTAGWAPNLSCLSGSWGRWATTAGAGAALGQHHGASTMETAWDRIQTRGWRTLLACSAHKNHCLWCTKITAFGTLKSPFSVVEKGRKFEIEYSHLLLEAKQITPCAGGKGESFPPVWAAHCSSGLWRGHSPFPGSPVP